MADETINYPFGDLNPAFADKISKKYPSTTGIKASALIQETIGNNFKTDALKAVGRMKAVVLRVENSTAEPGEWWSSDLTLDSAGDDFVRIKARIPELHPFPIPESNTDHKIINLYPTFKAQSKNIAKPNPGDLVWVDFGNRETQEDPIYVGPIKEGRTSVGAFGSKGTSATANQRKSGTLKSRAASGDKIGRTRSVGSSVPIKKIPGAPTYSRDLNDIDFNKVSQELIDKWDPSNTPDDGTRWRVSAGNKSRNLFKKIQAASDKNLLTENEKWTIIIMGAAEVIEKYWRQEVPKARVIITSHFRSFNTKNHNGGAIDFKIREGSKDLSALQAWSGIMKLHAAGALPNGGRGIYLNVSPNGVKGLKPEEAGKGAASFAAPPGGSAAPHYDFRGHYGYQLSRKGYKWISLDLTGEGRDDIPGAYISSERKKALKYLKGSAVTIKSEGKYTDGIHPSLKGKTVTAEGTSGRDLNFLYNFFNDGWATYEYSPGVSAAVPNLLEVLGQGNKKEKILVQNQSTAGNKEEGSQTPKVKEG